MYIKKLYIHDFRKFSETEIHIGRRLTCLSGHNAVGKSTILGILANSSELKKETGTTINNNAFKVDLKEIMKFSKEFDPSGSNKCTIKFGDVNKNSSEYVESISFRATWQNERSKHNKGKKRYRLLPMKTEVRRTERKIQWPTLYLGLSRLYPIGEVDDNNVTSGIISSLTSEEKEFLFNNHKKILASNEDYEEPKSLKIKNTKKTGFGIKTNKYDALSNSSGQDNLGQILVSLLSFKRLREKMGDNWIGGLFLIDEVDATLHPIAQNKLIDFFYDFSNKYDVQIVFTTHSMSLLEHISSKYYVPAIESSKDDIFVVEQNYLTTGRGIMENHRNPDIDTVKKDLLNQIHGNRREIKIYSEDEEARWFLEKLLNFYSTKGLFRSKPNTLGFIKVNLGNNQLLKLLAGDYEYFSKNIIMLDGDTSDETINKALSKKTPIQYNSNKRTFANILVLPGGNSPEKILWDYLQGLPENHNFFLTTPFDFNFKKQSLIESGPFTDTYKIYKSDRDKYKNWFITNKFYLDYLIEHWIEDNLYEVLDFLYILKDVHNRVAKKNMLNNLIIDEIKLKQLKEEKESSDQI